MTTPNGKHEFEGGMTIAQAVAILDQELRDRAGAEHLIPHCAEMALSALSDYERVKEDRDILSESYRGACLRIVKLKADLAATNKAWDIKQKQLEEARAEVEKARPLIEAARGVDKRVAWQELANSDIVHGLDGGLYDLLTAIPEDK